MQAVFQAKAELFSGRQRAERFQHGVLERLAVISVLLSLHHFIDAWHVLQHFLFFTLRVERMGPVHFAGLSAQAVPAA